MLKLRAATQLVNVAAFNSGVGVAPLLKRFILFVVKHCCNEQSYFVVMDPLNVMLGHKVPGTCLRARVGISDRGVYLSYDLNVGAVLPDFAKNKRCHKQESKREREGTEVVCVCV